MSNIPIVDNDEDIKFKYDKWGEPIYNPCSYFITFYQLVDLIVERNNLPYPKYADVDIIEKEEN